MKNMKAERKNSLINILICGLTIVVFGTPVFAKTDSSAAFPAKNVRQNGNTINGMIYDPTGRPASQIYVELLNELSTTVARTRTDGGGRFYFNGLSYGRFRVKVLTLGTNYLPYEEDVQLVNVSQSGIQTPVNEYLEIKLRFDKDKSNNAVDYGGGASAGVIFAQDIPKEARKLYEKGAKELDDKKSDDLESLKKALEIFPDFYLALDRLGVEYVRRGQYETALPFLIKAVEVNERSFSSFYSLGMACLYLNHLKESVEAFRATTIISPQSPYANFWYGVALRQNGNFERAEKSLLRANELSKKSPIADVHWQLALIYNRTNRNKEAIAELEMFLKLKPDNPDKAQVESLIARLRAEVK